MAQAGMCFRLPAFYLALRLARGWHCSGTPQAEHPVALEPRGTVLGPLPAAEPRGCLML